MGGEALIPKEEGHNWLLGTGILYDAQQLLQDTHEPTDAFDWSVDGVSAGLDALIVLGDPLGAAVAAGVGFILENIPGIRDVWNMLAGNPEEIQRASLTWSNIATRLREEQSTFGTQAGVIERWEGPAAASFRRTASQFTDIIGGVAGNCEFLSVVIAGVGAIVAALREVCYWAITEWLMVDVIPEAIASLASSWCTFGASVAAFLAWLIISSSITMGVLGEKIGMASVKVAEVYAKVGARLTKLASSKEALEFGIKALEGAKKAIDNPYVWAPRGATRSVDGRNKTSGREGEGGE